MTYTEWKPGDRARSKRSGRIWTITSVTRGDDIVMVRDPAWGDEMYDVPMGSWNLDRVR